jgi:hypothetical protein
VRVEISTSVGFENKVRICVNVMYMKVAHLKVPTSENLKKLLKI